MEITPEDITAINRFKDKACRKKTNLEIEKYDNIIPNNTINIAQKLL